MKRYTAEEQAWIAELEEMEKLEGPLKRLMYRSWWESLSKEARKMLGVYKQSRSAQNQTSEKKEVQRQKLSKAYKNWHNSLSLEDKEIQRQKISEAGYGHHGINSVKKMRQTTLENNGIFYKGQWYDNQEEIEAGELLSKAHIIFVSQPEPMETPFGAYCPDFYLLRQDVYIDIKSEKSKKAIFGQDQGDKITWLRAHNTVVLLLTLLELIKALELQDIK